LDRCVARMVELVAQHAHLAQLRTQGDKHG